MGTIKKGLDSFQLKIVALAIMTIDHIAAYGMLPLPNGANAAMRMLGRAAAPLFLFLLARGLRHTRSKARYTLRLYFSGAALQMANEITENLFLRQGKSFQAGNIFQTLFYVALYVSCLDMAAKQKKNIAASAALMALPFLLVLAHIYFPGHSMFLNIWLPSPLSVEYSFLFVLLGIFWYAANDKIISCAALLGLSALSWLIDYRVFLGLHESYGFTFLHMFYPMQWLMALAALFIVLYNGEKGKTGLKYLFYAYYPLHQYLFLIVGAYLIDR